jgi:ubiquinone/menaquinone biosynthesis C-methylase UbiE
VDSSVRLARSFGGAADEYERGRPGYPAAAIDRVAAELGLGEGSVVVDLAAGTGKLTRDLVPRFGRVIAIDPLDAMLARLLEVAPAAETMRGSAEAMPLEDAGADAVLVAQAFHWFDGEAALAEIARVLGPRGGLGLLWNSSPWELREGPWFAALDDLLEENRVDLATAKRHGSGLWRRTFERDQLFEPLQHAAYRHEQRVPRGDFLAGLASRSYIATLAASKRASVLEQIDALLERNDAPMAGSTVTVPLTTAVFWTRKRAEAG